MTDIMSVVSHGGRKQRGAALVRDDVCRPRYGGVMCRALFAEDFFGCQDDDFAEFREGFHVEVGGVAEDGIVVCAVFDVLLLE